jgi:hypothetical protein
MSVIELPSDISGNPRHDHWHIMRFNGGNVKCFKNTSYSYGDFGKCSAAPESTPPPRPSPMPDYLLEQPEVQ